MFGCYRRGDANDPDIYVTAVAAVLERYPEQIIETVTNPVSGLPGTSQWLPSVAEVKAACEAEATRLATVERYARLQARPVVPALPKPAPRPGLHPYNPDGPRPIGRFEEPDDQWNRGRRSFRKFSPPEGPAREAAE